MASKVLDTMRKLQPSGTVPFSLKQQYVPVVRAAQEAAGPGNGKDGEDEEQAPVPPGRKRKSPSKDCESKPHQEWNYSNVRASFIQKARLEQGVSYGDAKSLWDESSDKRHYLKDVSVQELKRRKFITKDCTVNPWSD